MSDQQPESQKPASSGSPKTGGGIDPMKVMADALQAMVSRPGAVPVPSGDDAPQGESGPPAGASAEQGAPKGPDQDGVKRTRKRKRKRGGADGAEAAIGRGGAHARSGRPGRGTPKKRSESPTAHANDAVRSLSAMLRSVFESQEVHFLSRPRYTEVNLRVPLDARLDGSRCASKLVDAVLKLVREVRDNDNALAPGSVFCFFSESAEAEGCRPTEPRQVFDGYSSTGRPQFTDFITMAIERKSAGIDALLAGEDMTLTHVTQGRVLRTAQLAEFGKASAVFRILGQVDAGLFGVRGQEAKAAFSFQVLLGKDLQGQPVLRLHPVGHCDVLNLVDHSIPQILQRFQGDLDEAALRLRGLQANGDAPEEEEFVLPMLQDLAKQLQDRARHRSRRTEHAEQRAAKGTRPTTKAYDEAAAVGDDGVLWDDQENTVVVIGGHGRVHVFTPEAKHVTSVNMNRATVQQRMKTHRWRNTEPGERGGFRMKLRSRMKSQRDEESAAVARGPGKKKQSQQRVASDQLQSKIAGLMAGLGAGAVAATDAVTEPVVDPAVASAAAPEPTLPIPAPESGESPAAQTPPAETPSAETSAAESSPAETPAAETPPAESPAAATEAAPKPEPEAPQGEQPKDGDA